jgi:hypothetical protein
MPSGALPGAGPRSRSVGFPRRRAQPSNDTRINHPLASNRHDPRRLAGTAYIAGTWRGSGRSSDVGVIGHWVTRRAATATLVTLGNSAFTESSGTMPECQESGRPSSGCLPPLP